jgi:magnesium-dependent phosphatase 1
MLIVFDLDFTLWDAGGTFCDGTVPPYSKKNGYITDAEDRIIYLYPDVVEILSHLEKQEIAMGVASRTHSPDKARTLMEMFGIRDYFSYEEIYAGSKVQHFEMLQRRSKLPFEAMFFFDDEQRNVREVGELGVLTHHVPEGLSWHLLNEVDRFR